VVSIPTETELSDYWRRIPVRQVITMFSIGTADPVKDGNITDILRTFHVIQWRRESRFCGTCGAKNNDVTLPFHRICYACGRLEFPRICPAVIVAITDDENRLLLAHNKNFRAGMYSHISGFNEAGESLEETVIREIREEVNINVKDIAYARSQPWPFPNSLMVGFKARYASGVLKPDGEEIEDAAWFSKNNLPDIPSEGSLARFLINDWLNETI
jgi:NAD+ diphosphatase